MKQKICGSIQHPLTIQFHKLKRTKKNQAIGRNFEHILTQQIVGIVRQFLRSDLGRIAGGKAKGESAQVHQLHFLNLNHHRFA